MATPPSPSREYRGSSAAPTFQGETLQFGDNFIIGSLVYGRSRRAACLERVSDGQHLQGKHV
jgi:hypothetical protein